MDTKEGTENIAVVACDGSTLPDQNAPDIPYSDLSVPAPVTTTINTKLYMLRSHPGPCNGRGNLSLSLFLSRVVLFVPTHIFFRSPAFFPHT